jgi:AcrR family transcriptional regulator
MTPGRGRPRDPRTDDRIARAALDLLREQGPAGVHIDTVATRAGVARTTIYRRYRDRAALLGATLGQLVETPFPARELSLEDKLRWLLEEALHLVEEQLGRGAVAAVLADSDPAFSAALRAHLVRRLKALQVEIDADIKAGRIHAGTDGEALADLALGAYLAQRLRRGHARRGWAEGVVGLLLHGTIPAPG